MLDLGAVQGWTPTVPPSAEPPRAGTYTHPAGMTISDEDAAALRRCIEAELPSIDDEQLPLGDHAFGEEHTQALLLRRAQGQAVEADQARAAREILSGPPKQDVRRLARFMGGGAFSVDRA